MCFGAIRFSRTRLVVRYYDAHVHFFWKGSLNEVWQKWQVLLKKGLTGVSLIIIGHYPSNWERFLGLVPNAFQKTVEKKFFEEGLGFQISTAQQLSDVEVFPYLDCRFIDKQDSDLTKFVEAGFKGLKVLYIPDDDYEFGAIGWRQFFGRSEAESQKLISQMIEQSFSFGWPIIFHVDLRRYADFVMEILQINPACTFIIPHFGFSRKILAKFLERFNCCYTDFSSLLPFMQDNPHEYVDFITTYNERILFASDAYLGEPELAGNYLEFIISRIESEDIRAKIMYENYLHIHRIGLQKVGE